MKGKEVKRAKYLDPGGGYSRGSTSKLYSNAEARSRVNEGQLIQVPRSFCS